MNKNQNMDKQLVHDLVDKVFAGDSAADVEAREVLHGWANNTGVDDPVTFDHLVSVVLTAGPYGMSFRDAMRLVGDALVGLVTELQDSLSLSRSVGMY